MRPHPEHHVTTEVYPGMWVAARPIEDTSWWHRWRARRACRRAGGHWWHLDASGPAWDTWYCCQCGAPGEGMPQDGGAG